MSKNSAAKFTLGALIGAVAGFIAGILTAPKSGKALRTDIVTTAKGVKDKTVETAESAKDKVEETVEDVKEKVDDVKTRAQNAAKAAKAELTAEAKKK